MILHIIIMLLSLFLIYIISRDTFKNEAFYTEPHFQKVQFWICMVFLFDFFVEFFLSDHKWDYLKTHFIFFLVSIPYQAILFYIGIPLPKEIEYLVRYIPLIRGGYALAIVVSWFTYNRATSLFWTYIITLLSTVYFASLTFYLFEYKINPLVENYPDALWWAFMDVTTVGSNITAVTTVGRVLSVLLAALGMMMFPIFTVYVTNIVTKRNKEASESQNELSIVKAYHEYVKKHPDQAQELREATSSDETTVANTDSSGAGTSDNRNNQQ